MESSTRPKAALISLILLGLIAVIPFILPYHEYPLVHFYNELAAFALGVAACFPFLSKNFWQHLQIPQVAIWLFGVVVLIAIQPLLVNQAYSTQALLAGIYISWVATLVILAAWIRDQLGIDRAVTVLAWMIAMGGTLQALIGLIQYFGIQDLLAPVITVQQGSSIYGNINQRNHFSTHLVLASFALIYLHAAGRAGHALGITLLTLFAFILTAAGSRTAAVCIVSGFVLSLTAYRVARTPVHYRLLQGSGLLLLLFLLFQYLQPLLNDWLKLLLEALGFDASGFHNFVVLQRGMTEGVGVRLSEWRKAWRMAMESPLWGIGIGNYAWHSFNYQALPEFSAVSKNIFFHNAHNLPMQVFAELGMAGLLLLGLMAIVWFRQVFPLWKNPPHWLIFTFVSVLFLHSNVEYPLWYSFFLGLAAVLMGLGSAGTSVIRFTPVLGQCASGATLLLSSAILGITFLGFQDVSQVYRMLPTTASRLSSSAKLHAVAGNPLLTPWAEAAIVHQMVADKNTLDQQLALTARVMQIYPNSINVNLHIIYLVLTGKSMEASALLEKAFIVYPADLSRLACYWKTAPAEEIQRLWDEAEKLTGGTMKCQTKTKTSASSS